MSMHKVRIFNRFERFWHWTQMLLIFVLLATGFSIHGLIDGVDFEDAVTTHVVAALGLMLLWVFAVFWHLTTGTWRHYLPTTDGLWPVVRFYAWDIFRGKDHPYRKHFWRKHNPLQAATYLLLKLVLFPLIWISGLLYLSYGLWSNGPLTNGELEWVAWIHTFLAFAMLAFIIAHVYMLTTGHSFVDHVKPMITGYDDVDLSDEELAYLRRDEPWRLKE